MESATSKLKISVPRTPQMKLAQGQWNETRYLQRITLQETEIYKSEEKKNFKNPIVKWTKYINKITHRKGKKF